MRVGLYFDLRDPEPWRIGWPELHARALDLAEEWDRRGIDSIWFSEHHFFADGYLPQPFVFMAAVAARTKRARLGTAVMLAPLRDPVTIAEEAALVDSISGGRLDLGVGAGYRIPEFEAFGEDIGERFETLEARTAEVRRLWDAAEVTPGPAADHVPFWLGANGKRTARMAGRLGAGLLTLRPSLWDSYVEAFEAGPGAPHGPRAAGPMTMVLCDDPERTWDLIRPAAEQGWKDYDFYAREGRGEDDKLSMPPVFDRIEGGKKPPVQAVTVDEAVETLASLAEGMPVHEVFMWERVAGMPDEIAARHAELVIDELRPRVADL